MKCGFGLGKPAARVLDPRIAVLDDGLPRYSVDREYRPPLRFRQQCAIAYGIRFRGVDIAISEITERKDVIQCEQLSLSLISKRRNLLSNDRDSPLVLPGVAQSTHQQLLVTAGHILVVVAT